MSIIAHMDNPNFQETEYLGITEAAEYLRVSASTLRRWEKKGFLIPERTPTGIRRYTRQQLDDVLNNPNKDQDNEEEITPDRLAHQLHQYMESQELQPPAQDNLQQQSYRVNEYQPRQEQAPGYIPSAYQAESVVNDNPPSSFTISSHRAVPPPLHTSTQQTQETSYYKYSAEDAKNQFYEGGDYSVAEGQDSNTVVTNEITEEDDLSGYLSYRDENVTNDLQAKLNSLSQSVEHEPAVYPSPIATPKYSSISQIQNLPTSQEESRLQFTQQSHTSPQSLGDVNQPYDNFAKLHNMDVSGSDRSDFNNFFERGDKELSRISSQSDDSSDNISSVTVPVESTENSVKDSDTREKIYSTATAVGSRSHSPLLPVMMYLAVFFGVFIVALGAWFAYQAIAGGAQQELLRPVVR